MRASSEASETEEVLKSTAVSSPYGPGGTRVVDETKMQRFARASIAAVPALQPTRVVSEAAMRRSASMSVVDIPADAFDDEPPTELDAREHEDDGTTLDHRTAPRAKSPKPPRRERTEREAATVPTPLVSRRVNEPRAIDAVRARIAAARARNAEAAERFAERPVFDEERVDCAPAYVEPAPVETASPPHVEPVIPSHIGPGISPHIEPVILLRAKITRPPPIAPITRAPMRDEPSSRVPTPVSSAISAPIFTPRGRRAAQRAMRLLVGGVLVLMLGGVTTAATYLLFHREEPSDTSVQTTSMPEVAASPARVPSSTSVVEPIRLPVVTPFGTLRFQLEPADALVRIDGIARERGTIDLELGPHVIQISRAGYRSWRTNIEVTSADTVVWVALRKKQARPVQRLVAEDPLASMQ